MTDQKPKLGIVGADGRMGQAVQTAAQDQYDITAKITLDSPDYERLSHCDVVIDFSSGEALVAALPHLSEATALISGTTGLSSSQENTVERTSHRIPIFRSGNFSLGIAVLSHLAEQAARTLGPDWDIEILEMHHRHKVDAPSGTAVMLGDAVASGRHVALDAVSAHDRAGERRVGDIGFSVLRGGGVYGLHEIRLVSESEMITLGHQALNRDVFAHGALAAAQWAFRQPPGLYSMRDLIPT